MEASRLTFHKEKETVRIFAEDPDSLIGHLGNARLAGRVVTSQCLKLHVAILKDTWSKYHMIHIRDMD